jgi:hypothetical protein
MLYACKKQGERHMTKKMNHCILRTHFEVFHPGYEDIINLGIFRNDVGQLLVLFGTKQHATFEKKYQE